MYKTGNTTGPVVPPSVPTSGTTLFPHVIQGHGQLAESPLYDKLFVIIMHLVIHQALENKGERQSVNRKRRNKEPEMERLNRNVLGKKRSATKTDAGAARCTFFKRQLLEVETFTNASLI